MLTTETGAALVAPSSVEESTVKIKLKRNTVLGPGVAGEAGKVYDIDDKTARYLVGIKKAVYYKVEEPVIPQPEPEKRTQRDAPKKGVK